MRRLNFPITLPYTSSDYVVTFEATLEELRPLGEPGFIEGDPARTASGRELYWAFETDEGLRFQVQWAEPLQLCTVIADPPDPPGTVEALRALGLGGLRLRPREPPTVEEFEHGHARGAVWLFIPEGMQQPTAIFSRKRLADQWLARNRGSGILRVHPIDTSFYDLEQRFERFELEELPPRGSTAAHRFLGTRGEWYEYVEGKQLRGQERWQLWRQDDHGTRFLMAEFDERSEAVAECEKMERRGHKQTYWVSQWEKLGRGGGSPSE